MLRLLKIFSGICVLVGFAIMLNTAGLADAFAVDFMSILVGCGLGLLIMCLGCVGVVVTGYA